MKNKCLLLVSLSLFLLACNNQTISSESSQQLSSSETINSSSEESSQSTSSSQSLTQEGDWNNDGVLKILTIGNSFSDDSMEYVANIALDVGVTSVVLGNLYIGGCSLATHATNARTNAAKYEYRLNTGSGWSTTKNFIMSEAIISENWDYISLQQSSGTSGISSSYTEPLAYLIDFIYSLSDDSTKIVWNMTWAYQQNSTHKDFVNYGNNQMTMYNSIVNAVTEEVLTKEEISLVIPTGTAIQNARTSFVGDNLTRDGYHLTYDLGRYVAGLTFVNQLTGLSIDDVTFKPSSLDDNYKNIAIESANNAVLNPFEITQSQYETEPEYDYLNYNEIDLGLTPYGYWQAMDANSYNKIITTAGNSKQYYATKRFTRMDLPLGTIIEIKNGWQYRPEAWKDDTLQTYRPPLTSTRRVEVTTSWWSDYVYRAFNISRTSLASLQGDEEALTALKIYVPKDYESEYSALEYEKIDNAFWDSSHATDYNRPIDDNESLSIKFFTTKRFTPEELPLGTIIKIASGWQYRPDAWKDDAPQNTRPGNVQSEQVVVTSSWWGDYIYRAFNVSKIGQPPLTGIDTNDILQIYIPII